eukprot:355929-Chlamydomonas_euryale.AAC.6
MPCGLMCRSALTAAECSVSGESFSDLQATVLRESVQAVARLASRILLLRESEVVRCPGQLCVRLPPSKNEGNNFFGVAKHRFKPGNGFLDVT